MMNLIVRAILASAVLGVSTQAQAADWWYVPGDPDAQMMEFVDAGTIERNHADAVAVVMRVDPAGHSVQRVQKVHCGKSADGAADAVIRNFMCGGEEYRMNNAVMLGAMTPSQAAHVVTVSRPGTTRIQTSSR